jgi:hypothetical protein
VLRSNLELERHIQTWLVPEVERRREELQLLNRKLDRTAEERAVRADRDRLLGRVAELEGLTTALTASKSWKLTAPLRAVQDALQRRRSRPE